MVVQNTSVPSVHIANLSERGNNIKAMTYKNKLTVCFDDILKVGAEMMMQQQLKNVQLDSYLVNGFNQSQQRLLKEKVKLFHGILDDLETSLSQSSSYLETLTELGKEKEKEREEAEKKRAEEENLRKAKEQQELKKRQELEEVSQQQQQEQNSKEKNGLGLNFSTETPADKIDASGSTQNDQEPGSLQPSNQTPIGNTNATSNSATFPPLATTQSQLQQGQPSDAMFNDLNSMDISMFSGLENSGFDSTAFNATVDGTKGFDDNDLGSNYNDMNISSIDTTNTNTTTNDIKNSNDNNNNDGNDDHDENDDDDDNEDDNENGNDDNGNNHDNKNSSSNENSNRNNNSSDSNNDNNGENSNNDNNDGNNNSNNKEKTRSSGTNNNNIINSDLQTTIVSNTGDNPPTADNGEEYLTLNDFNDLNIDWSTTGDNGELDLSGFNI
ncbi:hypothetical protein SMKI_04G2240 [Saccharomyces mikatae IFO 1815]|uniref:Med2p n=1 Tax=Saccharomyces mikatae IFO 1815 TaxID=226126 RepID=A0AA35IXC1_SACMI|nr:uncharacterized protein SMKI_04G2240 [Saccharomyces mikatae IFO 1815]CAI4037887.1 hypothetical protein SMKI_04G2240 [Saccharomyces mikatae IFO 1815]